MKHILITSLAVLLSLSSLYAKDTTKEDKLNLELSLVAGGVSQHLTTKYEPTGGYTETHRSLGVAVSESGTGWKWSAQAFRFDDSYNKNSYIAVGVFGYNFELPYDFKFYTGIGAGYVNTSYYSGTIVLPIVELGWWRLSVQGSYLPEMSDTDAVIAAQLKFRLMEW